MLKSRFLLRARSARHTHTHTNVSRSFVKTSWEFFKKKKFRYNVFLFTKSFPFTRKCVFNYITHIKTFLVLSTNSSSNIFSTAAKALRVYLFCCIGMPLSITIRSLYSGKYIFDFDTTRRFFSLLLCTYCKRSVFVLSSSIKFRSHIALFVLSIVPYIPRLILHSMRHVHTHVRPRTMTI